MKDAGCDKSHIDRANTQEGDEGIPGAIWFICRPEDADEIRRFLREMKRGSRATGSDPIHDQKHSLDKKLLEELLQDYDVKGYPIVQYSGDAIFIPAYAPHQVQN